MGRRVNRAERRKPTGKFVSSFRVNSIGNQIYFSAKFKGNTRISIVKELHGSSTIIMSSKVWLRHLNVEDHFHSPEENLEVINEPDLILHQKKDFGINKVHFVVKDMIHERPRVVVVFTNKEGKHNIATGYYMNRRKLSNYLAKHKILYQRNLESTSGE